jgi:hypothetical protein
MGYGIVLESPLFSEIPPFIRGAVYSVDVPWRSIKSTFELYREGYDLDLDPDFQRPHVWNTEKKNQYIEFCLRGGASAMDIYFNCPNWTDRKDGPMVLVDGKQRVSAVQDFMENRVKAFGFYFNEFKDRMPSMNYRLRFNVNNLKTRKEVLQWYLDLNTGGVVHSNEEIEKVRELLKKEA